jgi:hypothetical protein
MGYSGRDDIIFGPGHQALVQPAQIRHCDVIVGKKSIVKANEKTVGSEKREDNDLQNKVNNFARNLPHMPVGPADKASRMPHIF